MATKPIQARAKRTREKLMTALEALLKIKEFEHISIADIAKEAGVAVGSVYTHFKDKEAFLSELLDNRMALLEERLVIAEANTGETLLKAAPDLRSAINVAVESAYMQVQTDAHIIRALHTQARLQAEHPDGKQMHLAKRAQSRATDLLRNYSDEIVHDDLEAAAQLMYYVLNIMFMEKALFASTSEIRGIRPGDEAIKRATADMLYLYLTQIPK